MNTMTPLCAHENFLEDCPGCKLRLRLGLFGKKYKTPVYGGKNKAWYGKEPGTIEIELTQGKVAIIDEEDWEKVKGLRWCASKHNKTFYVATKYNTYKKCSTGAHLFLHRLILQFPTLIVDHINGDGLDNRRFNLRTCSNSQNMMNRRINSKNNTSGYKGVCYHKRRNSYVARIILNYKHYHLGYFETAIDAAKAYNQKAIELHGEFAKLNEIPNEIEKAEEK